MYGFSAFALILCVILNGSTISAQELKMDWPQFRGPDGQGVLNSGDLPKTWDSKKNILWKVELPGAGTSSPIVRGSRIYVTSYSGYNVPRQPRGEQDQLRLHLHCLDLKTGKLLWTTTVKPKLPEQETIRDEHGYASSTPAIDDERIYVFFGKTGVFAFSHEGEQLWQSDVGSNLNGWGSANSPVLVDSSVIINASVESESLVSLDRTTGKENWRVKGIKESWSTPIIQKTSSGEATIVVPMFGKILAINSKTGERIWSCDTDISWYMVPGLVAHDGIVYCIGGRAGGALAVRSGGSGDVTRTHRVWTGKKGSNVSSPIYHKGHLFWMNDKNETAYCANAETGAIVYEERIPRFGEVYASPVLSGDSIYYLSRMGRVAVISAHPRFELISVNDFGERGIFNASPALTKGKLLIRSNRFMYCIGSD